jgi:hypothetical protein
MKRPSAYGIAFLLGIMSFAAGGGWSDSSRLPAGGEDMERIHQALVLLRKVPSGRKLLERARKAWKLPHTDELLQVFRWSDVSKTDAVLTRKLNPKTGQEERERKVLVYLRKEQPQNDLLLDLAHELTHASHGPTWDPYDPELSPAEYIYATIEAEGGEVDALVSECQIALELQLTEGPSVARCKRYINGDGDTLPQRHRVLSDFYRVGEWKKSILEKLGPDAARFPLLSEEKPQLYSSTGGAPYPISLIREYEEITQVACENSRRRLDRLVDLTPSTQGGPARVPAGGVESIRSFTERFLERRCR